MDNPQSDPRRFAGVVRPGSRAVNVEPTVYIVDDDDAVRAAVSLLVHSCGWTPLACASAEEFLERVRRDGPSCLVLDLKMPGMTGADLLDLLPGLEFDLPVVVVTAFPEHVLAERARAAGVRAVLPKPFRDSDLINLLEDVLSD